MLPTLFLYPLSVQKLIRRLNTPEKVQQWLTALDYNKTDTMRTIIGVTKHKKAHCLEGAMSAAAILAPYYSPLILDLESTDLLDHTLFVYQRYGKWGAVGKSRDIGLDGRQPVFKTVRALAQSYIVPYIDQQAHLTSYGILDLRTLPRQTWRSSEKNVWYVEEALRRMRHVRLATPLATVRRWRRQYIEFKRLHPKSQPDYYPNRRNWI